MSKVTAEKYIKECKSYLGTQEGSYKHSHILSIYNNHKPLARGYKIKASDAWCATFVSAMSIACGCTDIIPTEVSAHEHFNLMKKVGTVIDNEDMQVGDIVYYDWKRDGHIDHVGVVVAESGDVATVIEGNKNNAVETRTIYKYYNSVYRVVRPKYYKETKKEDTDVTHNEAITVIAKEVMDGKYGNGRTVRSTNIYNEIQKKVNELSKK